MANFNSNVPYQRVTHVLTMYHVPNGEFGASQFHCVAAHSCHPKGRRLEAKKLQHITGRLKGKWATQNLGQVSSKPRQKN